jgi:hypothetical protein
VLYQAELHPENARGAPPVQKVAQLTEHFPVVERKALLRAEPVEVRPEGRD